MNKKAIVTLLAAAALSVAGCGSSSDPLSTGSGTPADSGGTSAPSASASESASESGAAPFSGESSPSGETASAAPGSGSATASSSGGGSGQPIVIGSADFTESVIIGEIYAAALNAKGISASTTPRLGAREVYIKAIEDGSINLVPEYSGTLLQYYDKGATATDSAAVYSALQQALPDNLTVLDQAPAEDKDSLTVTKETADKWGLKSIGDLKDHATDLVLGGPSEWKDRMTGVPGFEKIYGLTFKSFEVTDAGGPVTLKALRTGVIGAGNVFTTDPALAAGDLVALDDTEGMFGAQNVVPLIAKTAASDQVATVLNAVSAQLTTADLIDLNNKIGNEHADAAQVAADWLASKGLG